MRATSTNWKAVWLKLGGAAVPVVTIGTGSPIMFGILAVRRRSLLLAASAVIYLGTAAWFWVPGWGEPDHPSSDAAIFTLLASMVVASIQAALVIGGPLADRGAAERRQAARQLVAERPQTARTLGIGRPDLPRTYDDGGLVDLNDAPAEILAVLPGLDPQLAAAIVSSRLGRGRFQRVDELWSRGLLHGVASQELLDRLVVITVQDRR